MEPAALFFGAEYVLLPKGTSPAPGRALTVFAIVARGSSNRPGLPSNAGAGHLPVMTRETRQA